MTSYSSAVIDCIDLRPAYFMQVSQSPPGVHTRLRSSELVWLDRSRSLENEEMNLLFGTTGLADHDRVLTDHRNDPPLYLAREYHLFLYEG